eukprot:TRINITY_DN37020_c1_g1_i1.p1 TRINITY_DN37020_c1_g1~~TRINITY_DN37020_c1_g1_i1.p1  ORF type:complete len:130 (+),score=1.40 TRINITY_DN37020_c1_g1_i1:435-824(+)
MLKLYSRSIVQYRVSIQVLYRSDMDTWGLYKYLGSIENDQLKLILSYNLQHERFICWVPGPRGMAPELVQFINQNLNWVLDLDLFKNHNLKQVPNPLFYWLEVPNPLFYWLEPPDNRSIRRFDVPEKGP